MSLDKRFFKYWFLHALAFWLFFVMTSTGHYMYRTFFWDDLYKEKDGTVITAWVYFLLYDTKPIIFITLSVISLLIELNYKIVLNDIQEQFIKMFLKTIPFAILINIYYYFIVFNAPPLEEGTGDILAIFIIYILYSFSYSYIRYSIESRNRLNELKHQKTQAELNSLKTQLNPHFFFNTLNNLYGTALQENALRTVLMIEQLSNMMRYMMSEAQQNFTNIEQELNFISNYWALQEIRLPDKKGIQLFKNIDCDDNKINIAPLILIPFIENAFKYGISIDKPCKIDLNIIIKNKELNMTLSNIIYSHNDLNNKNGIGIENAKKRLDLIYKHNYKLTQNQKDNVYTVILNIKLN